MPAGSLEQRECFQNPGRAGVLAEVPWQEWDPRGSVLDAGSCSRNGDRSAHGSYRQAFESLQTVSVEYL
ncbi:hypothetical protein CapIbe_000378 [Capra ibex]